MPGRTRSRADGADSPTATQDAIMEDAPPSAQRPVAADNELSTHDDGNPSAETIEQEQEEARSAPRVKILPGSTDTAASFEFLDEGHTIGNVLRYIIMKNPDVEFCAYSIPHPSEAKMNVRIQTYDTTTATKALQKGLQDLEDLCDIVGEEYWKARNGFVEQEKENMQM